MFPYPSGKLHMGHVRNYTIGDVISRYKRLQDINVFQPMGQMLLVCLQKMLRCKIKSVQKNGRIKILKPMKQQLMSLGFSYDWSKELRTCEPTYYQWEQELLVFWQKRVWSTKEISCELGSS